MFQRPRQVKVPGVKTERERIPTCPASGSSAGHTEDCPRGRGMGGAQEVGGARVGRWGGGGRRKGGKGPEHVLLGQIGSSYEDETSLRQPRYPCQGRLPVLQRWRAALRCLALRCVCRVVCCSVVWAWAWCGAVGRCVVRAVLSETRLRTQPSASDSSLQAWETV